MHAESRDASRADGKVSAFLQLRIRRLRRGIEFPQITEDDFARGRAALGGFFYEDIGHGDVPQVRRYNSQLDDVRCVVSNILKSCWEWPHSEYWPSLQNPNNHSKTNG